MDVKFNLFSFLFNKKEKIKRRLKMRKITLLRSTQWMLSLILSQPCEQMSIKRHRIAMYTYTDIVTKSFSKNAWFLFYHIIRITIWGGRKAVMGFFVQIYVLGKWHLIVQMSKRE